LLFGFGVMLIANLTLLFIERAPDLVPSMMAKAFGIVAIPLVLLYSKRLMSAWLNSLLHFIDLDPKDVLTWFDGHIRKVFFARSNVACGFVVGLFILLFEYLDGAFEQRTVLGLAIVVLASLLMTSLGGFALTVMVRGVILVSQVGQLPIYVSASPHGVLSTGTMLLKGFGAATGVYVVAVLTMVLRTGPRPTWPILSWALFVAILYLVMFFLPQWTIHTNMVAFKRRYLIGTEKQLRVYLMEFDKTPNKATHDMVQALRQRHDELQSLPDWPFNWKNFTGILGFAFSSAFPVVLKPLLPNVTAWLRLPP
jgi:hypothetical protein